MQTRGTSANVNDVAEGNALLHGGEEVAFGDAGYQGVDKRADANVKVRWRIAMRAGLRKKLDKVQPVDALVNQVEYLKASVRAKVEHPFRVIRRQFGYVKVRYRGLKKNTAQLVTLFALSNLWMAPGRVAGNAQDGNGGRDKCVSHSGRGLKKTKYLAPRAWKRSMARSNRSAHARNARN